MSNKRRQYPKVQTTANTTAELEPVVVEHPVVEPKPAPELNLKSLSEIQFSPIQQRIMDLFRDGQSHSKQEIWECLQDTEAPLSNIYGHITSIRTRISMLGLDLVMLRGRYTLGKWNPIAYQ